MTVFRKQVGSQDGKSGEQQVFFRNGRYYLGIKIGQRWFYARMFETTEDDFISTKDSDKTVRITKNIQPNGYKSEDGSEGITDTVAIDCTSSDVIVLTVKNGVITDYSV